MLEGLGAFCKSYVVCAGWREGGAGLILGLLTGLFPVVAQLKARETLAARLRTPARAYAEVVGLGAR
jgi:hypothetical protein